MAATIPTDPAAVVAFMVPHAPIWRENAAGLGVGVVLAQRVQDLTDMAVKAQEEARAARQAAQAATDAYHNAARAVREAAAEVLRAVRNRASTTGDVGVYALAQVPSPRTRRRSLPPPNAPEQPAYALKVEGLEVSWRASHPRGMTGVVYEVRRMVGMLGVVGETGRWELLGLTGEKRFLDRTLPAGVHEVSYMVIARHGTRVSPPSSMATARFGASTRRAAA